LRLVGCLYRSNDARSHRRQIQLYQDGMFKFVLSCDKFASALGGVVLRNNDISVD